MRFVCLKQNAADEMRISDCGSVVCSSDPRFPHPIRGALVAFAAVLAASLAAGSAEHAAPGASAVGRAASPATACDVVGGELSWGFKESFRAYISGSIAAGEWTTSGGATYETPSFGWSGAGIGRAHV